MRRGLFLAAASAALVGLASSVSVAGQTSGGVNLVVSCASDATCSSLGLGTCVNKLCSGTLDTSGPAPGTMGGTCLQNTNSPCGTGLTCYQGTCGPTDFGGGGSSPPTAGTFGGACLQGNVCNSGLSCNSGVCIPSAMSGGGETNGTGSDPAVGSLGGVCSQDGSCNTGLACSHGYCYPRDIAGGANGTDTGSFPPAGTMGGSCLANNLCNSGLMCMIGFCVPKDIFSGNGTNSGGGSGSPPAPGSFGGACLQGNSCNADLSCFSGICISGVPGFPGFQCLEGNNCLGDATCNTATNKCVAPAACRVNADCGQLECHVSQDSLTGYGTCGQFPTLDLQCSSTPCAVDQTCFFGTCIRLAPPKECAIPCNIAAGETCDTKTGMCATTGQPQCGQACASNHGQCISAPMPGFPPMCVTLGDGSDAPPTCQSNDDCPSDSHAVCAFGMFARCGDFCQHAQAALDPTALNQLTALIGQIALPTSYTQFADPAATARLINATTGILQATKGNLLQLSADLTSKLQSLKFPPGGDASDQAGAQIPSGSSINLPQIDASSTGSQLFLGQGSVLNAANLRVPGALAVSLASGTAAKPTIASFQQALVSGPITIVSSGPFGVVAFPPTKGLFNFTAGGQVNVGGGASLRGFSNGCPIQIKGSKTNSGSAADNSYASIEPGQIFAASGPIIGSDATLLVNGTLDYSGAQFQPLMKLAKDAIARVLIPSGSTQFQGGAVNLASGAELQLNASDASAGDRVFFGKLAACPSGSMLTYRLSGSNTRDAALKTGFTFMGMAVTTSSERAKFTCGIQICDDAGCTSILNPNVNVASGRRLLDTTTNSASWSANKLTVSQTTVAGKSNAAATLQSGLVASTLLAVVVALAQLFM